MNNYNQYSCDHQILQQQITNNQLLKEQNKLIHESIYNNKPHVTCSKCKSTFHPRSINYCLKCKTAICSSCTTSNQHCYNCSGTFNQVCNFNHDRAIEKGTKCKRCGFTFCGKHLRCTGSRHQLSMLSEVCGDRPDPENWVAIGAGLCRNCSDKRDYEGVCYICETRCAPRFYDCSRCYKTFCKGCACHRMDLTKSKFHGDNTCKNCSLSFIDYYCIVA
jgi:hypothetical protein